MRSFIRASTSSTRTVGWTLLLLLAVTEPAAPATSPALAKRIQLADGFDARTIMVQGKRFTEPGVFPGQPDLITVFPQPDGGTVLYISHEIEEADGAVGHASLSRIALGPDGHVIQSGTVAKGQRNLCSGTVTPWGTVLTCEEYPRSGMMAEGYVWEFDPNMGGITRLDALGRFSHESAAFDQAGRCYLTEDSEPGHLFRFTPNPLGQLHTGILEVLDARNRRWVRIREPQKANREAKDLGASAALPRPEGIHPWPGGGFAVALTGEEGTRDKLGRVVRLNPDRAELTDVIRGDPSTLIQPDNLRFRPGGWMYICEDRFPSYLSAYGPNRVLAATPDGKVIKVLATIPQGEPAGIIFHPDGKRCYLNIQDETESLTLEITGPFADWEKPE